MKKTILLFGLLILFLPIVYSANECLNGDENMLVNYWDFEGDNIDSISNVELVPGIVGNETIQVKCGGESRRFNRIGDSFLRSNNGVTTNKYNLTIQFWFSPNGTIDNNNSLVTYFLEENGLGGNEQWQLKWGATDSRFTFYCWGGNCGSGVAVQATTTKWIDLEWYHIALTWNESTVAIYVNGTQEVQQDMDFDMSTITSNLSVNSINGGASGYSQFNGWMDELAVFDYAKTDFNVSPSTYGLNNCSSGITTLNITILNESTDEPVSATMDVYFNYNISNTYLNYSTSLSKNNQTFCIYPNSTTFQANIQIAYTISGDSFNYFINDIVLTNTSQDLLLYGTSGTDRVIFTILDLNDDAVVGAYIKILKYNLGTNSYKAVEIIKTNTDGKAIGNIVLYTEWYKFIIEYDGVAELVTEPTLVFDTEKTFRVDLTGTDWFNDYDTIRGVATNLSFNNATKNFKFTWNDPSGAMHQACLQVAKVNYSHRVVLCDNCTASTAGTILCNVGTDTSVRGNTYIAQSYFLFDTIYMDDLLSIVFEGDDDWQMYNKGIDGRLFGLFLGLLLIIALTFVGIWNPVTAIVMNLVAFFIISVMGFVQLQLYMFVSLVILGVMALIGAGRR